MLNDIDAIIKIILGTFAVITGVYSFLVWLNKKIKEKNAKKFSSVNDIPHLDSIAVNSLFLYQAREISIWRLLDFRRDIHMMDIHVQEILEVATPTGSQKKATNPFSAEIIYNQIVEGEDPDKRIIIVEGNAGSGKSTMLKHWALLLNKERLGNGTSRQYPIPVYLSLRYLKSLSNPQETINSEDLTRCFLNTIPSLPKELATIPFERLEVLRNSYTSPSDQNKWVDILVKVLSFLSRIWLISYIFKPLETRLQTYQQDRRKVPPEWIFLCDGLDEMPREFVESFISWVHGLPFKVCAVIATRPSMTHVTNLPQSRDFTICNFNDEQIHIFIEQWFSENKELGNHFLQEIRSNSTMREIVGIPLLLTFLSLEVEVSGIATFPKDLTQSNLLMEITEILLDKWEATKRSLPIDRKIMQLGMLVFERLAASNSYGIAVSYEQLEKLTDECTSELKLGVSYKDKFLSRIASGTQVVQGNRKSGYFFIHKIFFDFFFSRFIIRTVQSEMRMP